MAAAFVLRLVSGDGSLVAAAHAEIRAERSLGFLKRESAFPQLASICLRICFNFPLLVLKGIYHYRKFSRGLNHMDVGFSFS